MADDQAQFESAEQAIEQEGGDEGRGLVKLWISAIDAATKDEADWRKEGDETVDIYRSGKSGDKTPSFNILFSNTETLLPAVYNSTPNPDIRRRYNDDNPISKSVVDILERGIVYSLDQYDFDAVMRQVTFDGVLPGRGIARIRYVPVIGGSDPSAAEGDEQPESQMAEGQEHSTAEPMEAGERVIDEQIITEYVPWKNFRRGAGLTWDAVPWIAFEQYLARDQLEKLNPEIGPLITLDCTTSGEDVEQDSDGSRDPSDILLRAKIWEIWNKQTGEVLFICPNYPASPIRRESDPLGLTGFFPIPRPIQPIEVTNDLTPVPMYRAYKSLAEELNEITTRIRKLTSAIRVRALYASSTPDLDKIITADDNTLVPVAGLEMFAQGGLDKALAWWPIEPAIKALQQLYVQRDAVKSTIYEVSGLSDIMRGASNSNETAAAQQIKQNWGSLRIQRIQAEVARFVRDIFRMKAELLANKFDMQRLSTMTGVKLVSAQDKAIAQQQMAMMQQQPPAEGQPAPQVPPELKEVLETPTFEEVERLLRDDIMRSYKVDVESDSTIRADLARNQEAMVGFVQGTAQYIQAMGPAVQSGLMPPDLAVDIYASFARTFKLGKQVEDSLEKAAQQARERAQAPPAAPPPDPVMVKVEQDAKLKQADMQSRVQIESAKLDLEREKAGVQAQQANDEAARKHEMDMLAMEREHELKMQEMQFEHSLRLREHEMTMQMQSEAHQTSMAQAGEKHVMGLQEAKAKSVPEKAEKPEKSEASDQTSGAVAVALGAIAKVLSDQQKPREHKVIRGKDDRIEGVTSA